MALSQKQVNQNYIQALELSLQLVQAEFRQRGYEADNRPEMQEELAQSALADTKVIELLQTTLFETSIYKTVIHASLLQVKRELFADVNKRRFVSIDRFSQYENKLAVICESDLTGTETGSGGRDMLACLEGALGPDVRAYLRRHITNRDENRKMLQHWLRTRSGRALSHTAIQKVEQNIRRMKTLFPDGVINPHSITDGRKKLSRQEIIHCYKNILVGISHSLPIYFLKVDARKRAAIIIRFLIDDFLKGKPEDVLVSENSSFFIRYGIQGIFRFFNYSMNRVLYNAYPGRIMPWMQSRIENNYWASNKNRINAIRWLVEDKLGLEITLLKKQAPGRSDFSQNGLSYMFNKYYNSVSKALQAAYPNWEPWQLGNVPRSYWTDENAAQAVQTMIRQNYWLPEQLPLLYKNGELNRRTFGQAGLATVFQIKYTRSIYRAISAAFPGKFEPWELGKVPAAYWSDKKHITDASRWIAAQEGISPASITSAIRERRLSFKTLHKYPIGGALKRQAGNSFSNLFLSFFNLEQREQCDELRIRKKIRRLIRRELSPHPMILFLFYGIYMHLVSQVSREYLFRIKRLKRRRQRYRGIRS